MTVPVRLLAFALALVLVFAAGLGVGALAGPFDDDPAPPHTEHP